MRPHAAGAGRFGAQGRLDRGGVGLVGDGERRGPVSGSEGGAGGARAVIFAARAGNLGSDGQPERAGRLFGFRAGEWYGVVH